MKNVDNSSNSATPSIHVGLPTFSTLSASQRQGDSPSHRAKNPVGSSDSFYPFASQNSASGGYLGSLPVPFHSSALPYSSKGAQSVRGGSRTPSSRDSRVPHPAIPTGLHSMPIGSLVGTSTPTAPSALPTPVLVNFLMASPPSGRESNRGSGRARGGTKNSNSFPVTEGGRGMCRAMSSSLTWPSRHRSQSIATRESSHHSCEVLGLHGMLPRSPSLRTRRGPISPLLDEPDVVSKSFCAVSPAHRFSLLSHLGTVDRNGGGSGTGPGDFFTTAATSEEEAAAIAEFEVEAHRIPESELRSSVSALLQKVRVIQTELTQERETVHNLYDGVSRTVSDTEKRQEYTTNRMMRRLENLREKRRRLEKHLHDVRENKLEQERNLAKVKKNIEKLTEHLKSEEDVISRRIRRSIEVLKKKRLALEEALRNESYSVHQLEQLVNEFQLLDTSTTRDGGAIHRSTGSDVSGLAVGQVDKLVNSSTSTLRKGEGSSGSFSRKSSSSIPPQPHYRGPARLLEGKEETGSSHRSGETLFTVAEKAVHVPTTSILNGEGKKKVPNGAITSDAKAGQGKCSPLTPFTSVNITSGSEDPTDRVTSTPSRTTALKQKSTSKCAVQLTSRSRSLGSGGGSATFVAPPPPPLTATQTSQTLSNTESNSQVLVSLPDSSVPNTPNVDHILTDKSSETKNVSQVASIRFLEKAISILSHLWTDAIRQQENCRSQIQALQERVDEELQIKQGEVDALQHMKREFTESFGSQIEKSFSMSGDEFCRSSRHPSWPMPLPPPQQPMAKTHIHHSIEKEGSRDSTSDRSGHGRKTMGLSVERGRARRCVGGDARMHTSPSFSDPEAQGTSHVAPPPSISLQQVVLLSDMDRARQGGAGVPVSKPKGVGGAKGTVAFHAGAFHVITTTSLSDREVVGDGAENSSTRVGLNTSPCADSTSCDAPSETVDRTILFQDVKVKTPPPHSDVM